MSTTPTPAQEPAAQEPTTQERLAWMGRNSKKLILALVAMVIAAIVVTFSFSLFSSSSANPGNMVGTGTMAIENSKEGIAILTVDDMLPGDAATGTVEVTNVGDAAGDFQLASSDLVDTPATPPLSSVLNLVITDGATEVYNGPLASAGTIDLGTWQPDAKHTFTFTVTFAETAGNEYQDSQTTVDFTWDATQSTS
ncbi:hypothetical protein GON03_05075 [Nocardioides sp. MAH-18]|uniref:Uncharacterized protein n=1 Tax=Nocardioides agri TaxID=2682843 RepID=A0A6L6XP79_9ACTN|nr:MULTISPECIES: hypothetical protein [unclassified Nocardioides]MBA2953679.1 hypothetical protein [Nocardioides sp. CGMCC 1.13656]MVQ48543.1 hypothetical protein [Nocardioides sp. MAH-18]